MEKFDFKRFRVCQSGSAMKVGTDGVILGGWVRISPKHKRLLDIGTGNGLIALMLAQRTEKWSTIIDAVEIDNQSANQAEINFRNSEWVGRLNIYNCAIQSFESGVYDHIVSNPPYFVNSLTSPDSGRTTARHTDSLGFDELIDCVIRLLSSEGIFSLILPTESSSNFISNASDKGLFVNRYCEVSTRSDAPAKRVLLEFSRISQPTINTNLVVGSPEYNTMLKDFYLKL